MVVAACALLSIVPLIMVACVDLKRLQAYKRERRVVTAAQGPPAPRPEGEAACEATAELPGHHVMVMEGAVPHREGDLTVGLALEGEALPLHRDDSADDRPP